MEKDFCHKCGKCCKSIKVNYSSGELFFDGIQPLGTEFSSMLEIIETQNDISLCKCKFLKENLCTNTNKPDICRNYPSSPFANLPADCGYEGEIFIKNEHEKQKIRKLKEEIIHYEALINNTDNKSDKNRYQKIINSHEKRINLYDRYGAKNW